jgi:pimeloyl-ACP methyl ester carboxylesterase
MKLYKQIHQQARNISDLNKQAAEALLWKLLCYAPKVPLRMVHEQLLKKAENFQLPVPDTYFSGKQLIFNGFKWGNGQKKIFITHGWSSKAADFSVLIESLLTDDNVQVIAFDAPGNGSSAGELSNLILYIEAVKQIIDNFGKPDVLIGHSLGALANMITLHQLQVVPQLLISIAPVIRYKEQFFCNF